MTAPAAAFDLYSKLMAKREEAASFADEAADNSVGPTSAFEAKERGRASAFMEAAEMVRAAEDVRHPLGMFETPNDEPDLVGRFVQWSNSDCAAQCRMQGRENLDPELRAFWFELSRRLLELDPPSQGIEAEGQDPKGLKSGGENV